MAEPTSSYSFYDLILRVAEPAGMAYYGTTGQSKAMIPIDPYNLDLSKRIVNDGIKLFISHAPAQCGWRWQRRVASVTLVDFVEGTADSGTSTTLVDSNRTEDDDYFNGYALYVYGGTGEGEYATVTDFVSSTGTISFSGGLSGGSTPDSTTAYRLLSDTTNIIDYDPTRYKLPQYFAGEVNGPIVYAENTSHSAKISWCHPSVIERRRSVSVNTGYPELAAIRPYTPSSPPSLGSTRQWELLLDPQPAAEDTLEFPYTVYFDNLQLEAGLADSGTPTTLVDGTYRDEADDYFNSWVLTVIAGTGKGETATVTDYTGSTGTFTFSALSGGSTPDNTSVYYVQPASNLHPAGIAFDQAILSACLAKLEQSVTRINEGFTEVFENVDLPNAYKINDKQAPRISGNFYGKVNRTDERIFNNVNFTGD